MVLRAVVSQQLLPTTDGGLEPAFEVMLVNSAIQNMIRDGKAHQMDNVIFSGQSEGMRAMDADILRLYTQKRNLDTARFSLPQTRSSSGKNWEIDLFRRRPAKRILL